MRKTINSKVTRCLEETAPELHECLLLKQYEREYSECAGLLREGNCDVVQSILNAF
jgi:hypothetical protein